HRARRPEQSDGPRCGTRGAHLLRRAKPHGSVHCASECVAGGCRRRGGPAMIRLSVLLLLASACLADDLMPQRQPAVPQHKAAAAPSPKAADTPLPSWKDLVYPPLHAIAIPNVETVVLPNG